MWQFIQFCYTIDDMPLIKKTIRNPHGLSVKQKLVIADMVHDVEQGKKLHAVKSTKMVYNTNNDKTIANISSNNMNKEDFRQALIEGLSKANIIGKNSKVSKVINEGLDALTGGKFGGDPDYRTRLAYVQEINKITGVYAPQKQESRSLKINVDMSSEELQNKINELQSELTSD